MSAAEFGKLAYRARSIAKTLGHFRAARYLAKREVPFETAYETLFNRKPTI